MTEQNGTVLDAALDAVVRCVMSVRGEADVEGRERGGNTGQCVDADLARRLAVQNGGPVVCTTRSAVYDVWFRGGEGCHEVVGDVDGGVGAADGDGDGDGHGCGGIWRERVLGGKWRMAIWRERVLGGNGGWETGRVGL